MIFHVPVCLRNYVCFDTMAKHFNPKSIQWSCGTFIRDSDLLASSQDTIDDMYMRTHFLLQKRSHFESRKKTGIYRICDMWNLGISEQDVNESSFKMIGVLVLWLHVANFSQEDWTFPKPL